MLLRTSDFFFNFTHIIIGLFFEKILNQNLKLFVKMVEINETRYGIDLRNCSFFIDIAEPTHKTLLDQINDRYSELVDLNGSFSYSLSYKSYQFIRDKIETPNTNKSDSACLIDQSDIKIETKDSPRKSGLESFNILLSLFKFCKNVKFCYAVIASVSIVLNDKQIKYVGDVQELERTCINVQELDLSKNEFSDWDEVYILKFNKCLKFI